MGGQRLHRHCEEEMSTALNDHIDCLVANMTFNHAIISTRAALSRGLLLC